MKHLGVLAVILVSSGVGSMAGTLAGIITASFTDGQVFLVTFVEVSVAFYVSYGVARNIMGGSRSGTHQ